MPGWRRSGSRSPSGSRTRAPFDVMEQAGERALHYARSLASRQSPNMFLWLRLSVGPRAGREALGGPGSVLPDECASPMSTLSRAVLAMLGRFEAPRAARHRRSATLWRAERQLRRRLDCGDRGAGRQPRGREPALTNICECSSERALGSFPPTRPCSGAAFVRSAATTRRSTLTSWAASWRASTTSPRRRSGGR